MSAVLCDTFLSAHREPAGSEKECSALQRGRTLLLNPFCWMTGHPKWETSLILQELSLVSMCKLGVGNVKTLAMGISKFLMFENLIDLSII